MIYTSLGKRSHQIYQRKKLIYKFYIRDCNYINEKNFYLECKDKVDFIPRILYYSDKRRLIILRNEGKSLTRKQFSEIHNEVFNLYIKLYKITGYFHNDLLYRNVLLTPNGSYMLIDFERTKKKYKMVSNGNMELRDRIDRWKKEIT